VVALLIFTIEQNTAGVAPTPLRTTMMGTVSSSVQQNQQNSNFTLVYFTNMRTRIAYGTVILNSTGAPATCSQQPCAYARIALYANDPYNVTIEELVSTTVLGGNRINVPRDCQAIPFPYTPTTPTATQNFVCNTPF
jgi:hypothetical protein